MLVCVYTFTFLHLSVIMQTDFYDSKTRLFCYLVMFLLLRVIIYIFWQVTQGRKELIGLLRQQIVNVSVFEKHHINMSFIEFILFPFWNMYTTFGVLEINFF